jgi:hypothetical protein
MDRERKEERKKENRENYREKRGGDGWMDVEKWRDG